MIETNLALFILLSTASVVGQNPTASKQVMNAYSKQIGFDETLKRIERETLPKELKIYGGNLFFVAKTVVDRQIIIKWNF